jgi:hypothetical protein
MTISAVLGAVALFAVSAPADTLVLAPNDDQVLKYKTTSETTIDVDALPEPLEISSVNVSEIKIEVTRGGFRFTSTVVESSTEASEMITAQGELPSALGSVMETLYDPQGRVVKSEIVKMPEGEGMQFDMMLNGMKRAKGDSMMGLVLPKDSVSAGDSWKEKVLAPPIPGNEEREDMEVEYTFKSIEEKGGVRLAVILAESSFAGSGEAESPIGAMDIDIESKTEQTFWVDMKTGLIHKISSVSNQILDMGMMVQDVTEKSETVLIK